MVVEVIPISVTSVDWKTFSAQVMSVTGKSPTRVLDTCNIPTTTPFGFIAALNAAKGSDSHPIRAVRDAGHLLRHFSVGFLIQCSSQAIFDLMASSRVAVSPLQEGFIIATGSVFEWRDTFTDNLTKGLLNPEYRELLTKVFNLLEQAGLADIFAGYRRRTKDSFLLLEAM